MENENNTNRDVTVAVSPNLGSVGGQGGENRANLVEGLGTFRGATEETLHLELIQSHRLQAILPVLAWELGT